MARRDTRRRPSITRARTCGLYLPGHDVHWIQGLHSGRGSEQPPEPGQLLEVSDDGTIRVQVGDEVRVLWNHDPWRLAGLAAYNDGAVTHQPRWRLLRTNSKDGAFCFYVADADKEHVPCPTEPPTGNPIELLDRAGGFTLPVEEVLRWLDED